MKRFLIIFTILFSFFDFLKAYSYEHVRLQKLESVNSYQPLQFINEGYSPLIKNEKIDLKFQSNIKNAYIETLQIENEDKSPISKDFFIEENIKKPETSYSSNFRYNAPNPVVISEEEIDDFEKSLLLKEKKSRTLTAHQRWDKFWFWLKGESADDALLLGMQSVHTSPERDSRNNSNKGVGLQYGGVAAGYFYNSWYRDTYYLTVARRVWKKQFLRDFQIDLQYKAGVMHGYKEEAPIQLGFIEPLIVPAVGLSYKKVGTDIWIIPSKNPVFAANIRLGLPNSWEYNTVYTNIHRKVQEKKKLNPPITNTEYEKIIPQIEPEKL